MSDLPEEIRRARDRWRYTGERRPDFAAPSAAGEESVWDYPRPPRVELDPRHVVVRAGDRVLADTRRAQRVLETASPPTFYLPPADMDVSLLAPGRGGSLCEWKGEALYWDLSLDGRLTRAVAWSYPSPYAEYESIRDYFGLYPGRVECTLDGTPVAAQPGGFYGGWVTPEIVGPFKGEAGSADW